MFSVLFSVLSVLFVWAIAPFLAIQVKGQRAATTDTAPDKKRAAIDSDLLIPAAAANGTWAIVGRNEDSATSAYNLTAFLHKVANGARQFVSLTFALDADMIVLKTPAEKTDKNGKVRQGAPYYLVANSHGTIYLPHQKDSNGKEIPFVVLMHDDDGTHRVECEIAVGVLAKVVPTKDLGLYNPDAKGTRGRKNAAK